MSQKNGIEPTGVKSCALHRQQRGRTTVEKKELFFGFDEVATHVAPAAAESVATAENMDSHRVRARVRGSDSENLAKCVSVGDVRQPKDIGLFQRISWLYLLLFYTITG